MMIAPHDSTRNKMSDSIRNRVRSVRGRNIPKASDFQTQSHLFAALIGKSATVVVIPQ